MKYIAFQNKNFGKTKYYQNLPKSEQRAFDVLSRVFHFKINTYVLDRLIDWNNVTQDPIYRLAFLQPQMLAPQDFSALDLMIQSGLPDDTIQQFANSLRQKMAPRTRQAPSIFPRKNGSWLKGVVHNFETQLSLYPAPMVKTCHTYCSYCFRWILFNNNDNLDHTSYDDPLTPVSYLKTHPEISDVLFTGADMMVLKADKIRQYVEPILNIESVKMIRFSTKSLSWWPFRFTTDNDADELLKLFEYIVSKGKHLNLCAHITHVKELQTPEVKKAVARIQASGAVIRAQGPIVEGINDTTEDWVNLWNEQISQNIIPYYMFIEADHNSESCFRIPFARALKVYQEARRKASGLAKTVNGPVFMNDMDRVVIEGTTTVFGKKYFVLKSLQSPPHSNGAGRIRFLPYSEELKDAGNLFELFNQEQTLTSL